MPNRVTITHAKYIGCKVAKELQDGYISFAFPGKFVGSGQTMEEALIMARIRYRSAKKHFLESRSELDWGSYTYDRCDKMNKIHANGGIKDTSTWSPDNVDKT